MHKYNGCSTEQSVPGISTVGNSERCYSVSFVVSAQAFLAALLRCNMQQATEVAVLETQFQFPIPTRRDLTFAGKKKPLSWRVLAGSLTAL